MTVYIESKSGPKCGYIVLRILTEESRAAGYTLMETIKYFDWTTRIDSTDSRNNDRQAAVAVLAALIDGIDPLKTAKTLLLAKLSPSHCCESGPTYLDCSPGNMSTSLDHGNSLPSSLHAESSLQPRSTTQKLQNPPVTSRTSRRPALAHSRKPSASLLHTNVLAS